MTDAAGEQRVAEIRHDVEFGCRDYTNDEMALVLDRLRAVEEELRETQAWVRDQLAMCGDREIELEADAQRLTAELESARQAFDAADTIALREMRRANQAESDCNRLTAEMARLRADL